MPKAEIMGYVVKHQWDDGSSDEISVKAGTFEDTGQYVWVKQEGGDSFFFRPESWPLIRDKIDELFEQMAEEDGEGGGTE